MSKKWQRIRTIRRVVTGAIELERSAKRIGSSLEACVKIFLTDEDCKLFNGQDVAEICITSAAELSAEVPPENSFRLEELPDIAVLVTEALGNKCQRCWKILEEVNQQEKNNLCKRCAEVIRR